MNDARRGRPPAQRRRGLRLVRAAAAAPTRRSGTAGLGRRLAGAVRDGYARTAAKRPRAHKKKPKPIGEPRARTADESEVQAARALRERRPAA